MYIGLIQLVKLFAFFLTFSPLRDNETVKSVDDTLQLQLLFSYGAPSSSSFVLYHDSVYITTPSHFRNEIHYGLDKYYFDLTTRKFHTVTKPDISKSEKLLIDQCALKATRYISSISQPNVANVKIAGALKNDKKVARYLEKDSKVNFFNGEYFIINKIYPKVLVVYNPKSRKVDSYTLPVSLTEVTFLYPCDLDHDKKPEIFIFSVGEIPRDSAVSYSILSLRGKNVPLVIDGK